MEGDAGARRLNPDNIDAASSSEVTAGDSAAAGVDASTETAAEEDCGADVDQTSPTSGEFAEPAPPVVEGHPSRLGRGWLAGIAVALVVLAGILGLAGYLAVRANQSSQAIARHNAAALKAAKECVAATQAPDIAAMIASEQKIIDCSTGAFRAQAVLYSSLFVEAYQAANAHVEVSDMRAAVERDHTDGSVDVLVALRVKVSNSEAQNKEAGYRLRVTMTPEDGQYRIAKLDQVAK
jgi:Mce-associated membrane protein